MAAPFNIRFERAEALEQFAAELSLFARPGMALFLKGGLGAGKSTFARAFIRALAPQEAGFDVPSPTFTLVQAYDETRVPVAHADLYRVASSRDAGELGLEDMLKSHVLLVEWPEALLDWDVADMLLVELSGQGGYRDAALTAKGAWVHVLERHAAIRGFLSHTAWETATRMFLEGDASFRRYETLTGAGMPKILMDMPARPDGPPVKDGKPYSAIAHLAEDIRAVAAINAQLVAMGYSAPVIEACDTSAGLAVIEDLGRKVYGGMMLAGEDMRAPMRAAVEVLADMAGRPWPSEVGLPGGGTYLVPRYDIEAQLIEADLLPSWFWPHVHGRAIPREALAEFNTLWAELLPFTQAEPRVWVMRDYHSPNLLWLPERSGLKRVGIIDTQDCLMGHPAYDLASMLQDARVDVDFALADELYEHYCTLRAGFGRASFDLAYSILGAQRATKILGIFARLSKRDGKHGYLKHMPRVSRYLERDLAHPELARLKAWFDRHLPASTRERQP